MATKKTGKPPGRPRKHPKKIVTGKRERGRPRKEGAIVTEKRAPGRPNQKPLTAWPNRYEYAFAEGFMQWQAETQGISRNQSALAVAQLYFGVPDPTPANIVAALRGEGFFVNLREGCERKGNPNSVEWRDRDAWHLYAADMLRELRAINDRPRDLGWNDRMAALWRMALTGGGERKHFQEAERRARNLGELKYWRQRIKPVMVLTAAMSADGQQGIDLVPAMLTGVLRIEGAELPEP
jgi:hypothetical protein